MRSSFRVPILTLLLGASGFAQSRWTFGLQRQDPSIRGRAFVQEGSEITSLDLQRDLDLGRHGARQGFLLGYEGPRFLLELSHGGQALQGRNVLTEGITVGGTPFEAHTNLQTQVDLRVSELLCTLKLFRRGPVTAGLDLGIQIWDLRVGLSGQEIPMSPRKVLASPPPEVRTARKDLLLPLPQAGASLAARLALMEFRGSYRVFRKGSAGYDHRVLEAWYFPVKGAGLWVSHSDERVDIPKGSLDPDLLVELDRRGFGVGIVTRF